MVYIALYHNFVYTLYNITIYILTYSNVCCIWLTKIFVVPYFVGYKHYLLFSGTDTINMYMDSLCSIDFCCMIHDRILITMYSFLVLHLTSQHTFWVRWTILVMWFDLLRFVCIMWRLVYISILFWVQVSCRWFVVFYSNTKDKYNICTDHTQTQELLF